MIMRKMLLASIAVAALGPATPSNATGLLCDVEGSASAVLSLDSGSCSAAIEIHVP